MGKENDHSHRDRLCVRRLGTGTTETSLARRPNCADLVPCVPAGNDVGESKANVCQAWLEAGEGSWKETSVRRLILAAPTIFFGWTYGSSAAARQDWFTCLMLWVLGFLWSWEIFP
jgi:hypothetical protein